MPGPYSSLMVLRRRRSGRGGLRVSEKDGFTLLVALVLARRRRAAARLAPSHSGVPASSPGAGLGRLALLLQPLEGREAHHEPPSAPPICEVSQLDAAALEWLRVSAADGSSADTSAALSAGGVKLLLQLLQGCSLADEPAQEQAHAVARAAPRILERVLSARCAASEAPPDDESDVVRMLSALLQPLTAGVSLSCGWLLLAQALLEVLGSDPATGEKTITALAQYGEWLVRQLASLDAGAQPPTRPHATSMPSGGEEAASFRSGGVGLPPGWSVEARDASARTYSVYHGPAGRRAVSVPDAWRKHRAGEAAPQAGPQACSLALALNAAPGMGALHAALERAACRPSPPAWLTDPSAEWRRLLDVAFEHSVRAGLARACPLVATQLWRTCVLVGGSGCLAPALAA
ncbi:hypothetical protein EMIHUDRAFT_447682 [Emiliania huxleyi CCMP1516]|uniref:Uncharacterized protein n=2 Tax=Emiliania huxleyi TaxID=2903 RepID=A0A0D3JH27_EMIH1|nr:hypothetical protein EMIHUDRAFT_447682 [Emiliania huxleyi CCMP1516]EOD22812.1 hypothetical protein EMIHUDRAFT_447682 [Emiliania huxleyi CCMP1516]|eukprot:XP_005775241.1 hypothetical protein EMIHUDRAFT_447682 [Emiliania huxleyi CCMP1516]